MALEIFIDQEQFESLPEPIREHYVRGDDGNYMVGLNPHETFALEDVSGLKGALTDERETVKSLKAKAKAFEGLDPKKAREALKRVQEIKDKDLQPADEVKLQFEEREREILEKNQQELGKLSGDNELLVKQLSKEMIDNAALAAIAKHEGDPGLLLPVVRQFAKMEKTDDGVRVVKILDENGRERMTMQQNSTAAMGMDELVGAVLKKRHPSAFKGTAASGGGSGGEGGETGGFTLSRQDAKDPRKYREAKERAEKAGRQLQVVDS